MNDTADGPRANETSVPSFRSEEEAREFWDRTDSAPYFGTLQDVTDSPPSTLRRGTGRARSRAVRRPRS